MNDVKTPLSKKIKLVIAIFVIAPLLTGIGLYLTFSFFMPWSLGITKNPDTSWIFYAGSIGCLIIELIIFGGIFILNGCKIKIKW
jgi:hypothetical protein